MMRTGDDMECSRICELLGPLLDDELTAVQAEIVEAHLADCVGCRQELDRLTGLSDRLQEFAAATAVNAPAALWDAVEQRLDADNVSRRSRILPLFHRPLALAASVALLVGAALMFTATLNNSSPVAHASTIDYSLLMDGIAHDVHGSISRFLGHYGAKPIEPRFAKTAAPGLSFEMPNTLPGDFRLVQAYAVKFGTSLGLAATYQGEHEPLFLIFHPVTDNVRGPAGVSCKLGDLHGSQVEVGPWRLVHMMDETTCHCVLSTLDPGALADVVRAIAPGPQTACPHSSQDTACPPATQPAL